MDAELFDRYLQIEVVTFLLVFMRLLGLVLFAPILSAQILPITFRFYLILSMSWLLAATVPPASLEASTMVSLTLVMASELIIGLIVGTFLQFMFAALQLAGQAAGTQMGLALASVVNPQFDDQASTTAVVYATVASLIFLATGLDREMFRVVLESFEVIPLGGVVAQDSVIELVMTVFSQSMILAIRVAAPVVVALFMAELALGFVGRTVPQLNVLSVGFSLRIVLGLVITTASLSEVGRLFLASAGDALLDAAAAVGELLPTDGPE